MGKTGVRLIFQHFFNGSQGLARRGVEWRVCFIHRPDRAERMAGFPPAEIRHERDKSRIMPMCSSHGISRRQK
jgi:hypothetical protein